MSIWYELNASDEELLEEVKNTYADILGEMEDTSEGSEEDEENEEPEDERMGWMPWE
tara:strand:- start:1008 stop:1178 length:171 start_codon:yes stop_codon:yes gene_type:complete